MHVAVPIALHRGGQATLPLYYISVPLYLFPLRKGKTNTKSKRSSWVLMFSSLPGLTVIMIDRYDEAQPHPIQSTDISRTPPPPAPPPPYHSFLSLPPIRAKARSPLTCDAPARRHQNAHRVINKTNPWHRNRKHPSRPHLAAAAAPAAQIIFPHTMHHVSHHHNHHHHATLTATSSPQPQAQSPPPSPTPSPTPPPHP